MGKFTNEMEHFLDEQNEVDTSKANQLRHDILRDEWVIVSTNRNNRPDNFIAEKTVEYKESEDVFLDPEKTNQEEDVLIYHDDKGEWTTRVFPNKFPAVINDEQKDCSEGPYKAMNACGYHEVVITRDGRRTFALLEQYELAEVIDAYRERYLELMSSKNVSSITIFHNHGQKAGASVVHPHSQIITLPVVQPAVAREIANCKEYTQKNNEHLFENIVEYELENGQRIVYTNDKFIVYCPFASSRAFQMRVLPREPQPYFERITPEMEMFLADALSHALKALYNGFDDPDFNYYLHTAPCDGQAYDEYSYYIDIFPRTHVYAGFEFATDVEIIPVAPENAGRFLRAAALY
jgi:UDPglucose--hexose-1-phosphate uridylyltransferase